jgi:hypothetical protein
MSKIFKYPISLYVFDVFMSLHVSKCLYMPLNKLDI